MRKAALVGLIGLALVACSTGPPAATTTTVKRVNQSDAESKAERTVEAWNPDWRPFVYQYAATCPPDQPAQAAHRFICLVEIMAHVDGYPERTGVGYPTSVDVLIEVINPGGQMLTEVIEE